MCIHEFQEGFMGWSRDALRWLCNPTGFYLSNNGHDPGYDPAGYDDAKEYPAEKKSLLPQEGVNFD